MDTHVFLMILKRHNSHVFLFFFLFTLSYNIFFILLILSFFFSHLSLFIFSVFVTSSFQSSLFSLEFASPLSFPSHYFQYFCFLLFFLNLSCFSYSLPFLFSYDFLKFVYINFIYNYINITDWVLTFWLSQNLPK